MADEVLADKEEGERIERRGEEFFASLGIPNNYYAQGVLQPAVDFALAPATPADPANRPWVPLGPRNIGGRIRSLVQDPDAPGTLYAGTGFGGIFKTQDFGDTWEPIGGPELALPIGALALAPSDPRILYAGTGEVPGFPAGRGFFRSHDRGQTFTPMAAATVPAVPAGAAPQGEAEFYYQVQVDPAHRDRVWAASETGLWRFEPNAHASPAAGDPTAAVPGGSFILEPLPTASPVTDLALTFDPEEDRPSVGERQRLILYAGVRGQGVYRGIFDRANATALIQWIQLSIPFPNPLPGPIHRIRVAICRSNPRFVYVLAGYVQPVPGGATYPMFPVFRSEDGGESWRATPNPPDPGATFCWWAMAIAVHPFRPKFLLAGGLDVYRSEDGGETWPDKILDWLRYDAGDRSQHADQHTILFDLQSRNRVWVTNDGGISLAPDVRKAAGTAGFWRKRSHGILAAQFNDITVHPQFPYIMGGGLQDNGTYVGFGGPTWYHINGGDGGTLAFEAANPRVIYSTSQGDPASWNPSGFEITTIFQSPPAAVVSPAFIRSPVAPEVAGGAGVFCIQRSGLPSVGGAPALRVGPFVGKIEQPSAGQVLVAQISGAWLVTGLPPGVSPAAPVCPPAAATFTPPAAEVSALGFAPSAPATDQWVGTDQGQLWRLGAPPVVAPPPAGFNLVALPATHTPFTPAAGAAPAVNGALISRILVHPQDPSYVVVATGGNGGTPAVTQGRIFLTLDKGQNWADISGVGPPAPPAGTRALPPCPVTSLAFDPGRALGATQVLYAGTLVGVFKLENLPIPRQPPGPAPAAGAPPVFPIVWQSFNNANPGIADPVRRREIQLPLTLVKDLVSVTIPATPRSVAGTYENNLRYKLRCATFGRGMFECDITAAPPAANAPGQRLYIRQFLIEDGLHYPRPTPQDLNPGAPAGSPPLFALSGDPRFPTGAGAVLFTATQAYDIRIDSRDFSFFEDRVDGVELDEDLGVEDLVPSEPSFIYVQVHNRGTERVAPVDVHLFFAEVPTPAPAAGAPDLQGNFWSNYTAAALPATPVAAPAAFWQRVGDRPERIPFVRPNQPVVARFDWTPPAALASPPGGPVRNFALLAVCEGGTDRFAAPLPATAMAALLSSERRVALRVVPMGRLVRDVYIRDSADDDGTLGSAAFGGRSPDILVRQAAPADPRAEFRDLLSRREGDVVKGSVPNFVYVRVFNRKTEPVTVDVQLWWVEATEPLAPPDANAPPYNNAKWLQINPQPSPPSLDIASPTIQPRDWGLARFTWNPPIPDPEPVAGTPKPYRAVVLVALIASQPAADDPFPVKGRVTDLESFWDFFRSLKDSNNAAMRGIRYIL